MARPGAPTKLEPALAPTPRRDEVAPVVNGAAVVHADRPRQPVLLGHELEPRLAGAPLGREERAQVGGRIALQRAALAVAAEPRLDRRGGLGPVVGGRE